MRTKVRTSVMTLVAAALLAGATLAAISLAQAPASAVPNNDFTITNTISSSPTSQSAALLYPGVQRYIWYTVTNSLTVPITVTSLSISAATAPSGCAISNLNYGSTTFAGTLLVPALGSNSVSEPISLYDPSTSQNNPSSPTEDCANKTFDFTFTGTAQYTDVTTSVLSASPNPSNAGQLVTLTDAVTTPTDGNTPAGSALFYSCTSTSAASCSSTALGAAVALNGSGVATMLVSPTTAGTYYYEAVYTPADSTNFAASTSNVLTQTVNSAVVGSTVVLRSLNNPTTVSFPVAFVADVLGLFPPGPPFNTGTITFKDNGVVIPSCVNVPVAFGLAICSVTYQTTANSPHLITGNYSGDAKHAAGTSNTISETVGKATPTNGVTNSTPSTLGSTLKFTATVSGAGATPAGTVTWHVSTPSGVTACASTGTLSGGVATCSITASKQGSYAVSDSYGGDGNYASASSNTDTVNIAKATPPNVVTNSTTPGLGGTVKFTATVTGVSGITPTGSVTWKVSGSAGATSCVTTTVLASGAATCTITATQAGTYSASDSYSGDANYNSASSNTDTVTVIKATPTDALKSSLNPTTVGTAVTYTASLTGAGVTPTGSVTFEDGGSAITSCGKKGVVDLASGVATCTVTYTSTAGSPRQITASYGGDGSYNSANSNTVSETLNKTAPTNKVTNSSPTTIGKTVTFTATVAGLGVTPTGSIVWKVSGTAGATSCNSSTTNLSSGGTANCSITISHSGTYAVYETYGGDANYTSLTSGTDTIS
ncbi:MAG: Ig-like domain repeat protein [Acidimicrobiaceae bacterium]|nr:Ig-like domain repeat protein [Acidimicrobiaceae bacterium]